MKLDVILCAIACWMLTIRSYSFIISIVHLILNLEVRVPVLLSLIWTIGEESEQTNAISEISDEFGDRWCPWCLFLENSTAVHDGGSHRRNCRRRRESVRVFVVFEFKIIACQLLIGRHMFSFILKNEIIHKIEIIFVWYLGLVLCYQHPHTYVHLFVRTIL